MPKSEGYQPDYEYRAAWRAGVYEWWQREVFGETGKTGDAVTLTLANEWARQATDGLMAKWLDAWLVAAGLTGVLVVERGRGDGRLHAHGLLVGHREAINAAIAQWTVTKGFTLRKPTSDVMGWVMYMFKAVNVDTPIVWRRGSNRGESILTPADKPVKWAGA